MTVSVHNIFVTPIYDALVDIKNVSLEDINSNEFHLTSPRPNAMHISSDQQILNNPEFSSILESIDGHMFNFYHNILGYSKNSQPYMSASWIIKSNPGEESNSHTHANAIFSGVLYLQTEDNCGDITFDLNWNDDRRITNVFEPDISEMNGFNNRVYSISPATGRLIIFPSTLKHKVEINRSNVPRISIAFNYFLRGNFNVGGGNLKVN